MTGGRAPALAAGLTRIGAYAIVDACTRIRFAESVAKDLRGLRAYDRKKILDAIERQLSAEPGVATRHRKILVGLVPPFEAVPPIWQLAVGEVRVFYDLNEDDKTVVVRAVRKKPPHATTEDIL